MREAYQTLVREQQICGTQVHVDVIGRELVPPARAVRLLLEHLAEDLEESGDRDVVSEPAVEALARGSSAARRHRRAALSGGLEPVVVAPLMLGDYRPPPVSPGGPETYDEAFEPGGSVRAPYSWLIAALERIGPGGMAAHATSRDAEQRARGMFFAQEQDGDRLFPLDLVPRLIEREDWERLTVGLVQRARTLEMLLTDLHGERACLRDGVLPRAALRWLPAPGGRVGSGRGEASANVAPGAVRALVSGLDLVRDGTGEWTVLEDNLRIPSGIGYAVADRRVVRSVLPEIQAPRGVLDTEDGPAMLRAALLDGAPPAAGDDPRLAVVSEGPTDSAFFEHSLLAEEMGAPLLTPPDLRVFGDSLVEDATGRRIDVIYRRIDEEILYAATDAGGMRLGGPLQAAVRDGRLAMSNAPGNGLVDDKAVYPFVTALTEYYLGEKAELAAVPTWSCADPEQAAHVLENLDRLVLKPVDGHGGEGVVIGPQACEDELASAAAALRAHPAGFVAQETVSISTHPTFTGSALEPRVVDLRAFVVLAPVPAVLPTPLTRVAPADSLVVNSSRGGGSKDTWIVR